MTDQVITVVVAITAVVEVSLLLHSLHSSLQVSLSLRFILVKPGQRSVAPEPDRIGERRSLVVSVPGLSLRCAPVMSFVVVVTDGGVSPSLGQHCHLRSSVQ